MKAKRSAVRAAIYRRRKTLYHRIAQTRVDSPPWVHDDILNDNPAKFHVCLRHRGEKEGMANQRSYFSPL